MTSSYDRYKRTPDGLRNLVKLLETTPLKRREELIKKGMEDDAVFTMLAKSYIITFESILTLPEMQMAEILGHMKPQLAANLINGCEIQIKEQLLGIVTKKDFARIMPFLDIEPSDKEFGQAKLAAIQTARELEEKEILHFKKIPQTPDDY